MNEIDLNSYKHIHCIGIGGIGISAVAKMMLLSGKKVSGSDLSSSPVTEKLQKDGASIFIGPHSKNNLQEDVDLVVYSIAIPELDPNNPELQVAKERNILSLTYPEALGAISKGKLTVAISGTHGKTTTTAMTGDLLRAGRLDPMIIVGSFFE
jgi:UDP-N-acetylmuramate--alanine ligase